ncbi:hypothetical protein FisN_1Hh461 [Fistulifera solaris]|uniref:Thioredoxin domain-containing protein n=1 Tax=Fistulifera solaris TaxID=1519565 RepID=A0A1Z5JK19_FISSO|nr:hypothetical protein FisN_1Hh461 [Fistulifera solaris]|eukprot:GAX14266.1 hypothetical protein FisN_1Hh461 [Fistulifera solaris]
MRLFSRKLLFILLTSNALIHCIASTEEATIDLDGIATESLSDANPEVPDTTATDVDSQESKAEATQQDSNEEKPEELPLQSGPFIDLFGPVLLSLEMLDEKHAQLAPQLTNDALKGKKVVGLYFSADWCGPCRQFTPELNSFYSKMNKRRGRKDEFEIVWISRCRDTNSYGQYFTQMGGWLALPPEEAMGQRGAWLGEKFKVKSIPTLVLLDDLGNVITLDGRNKIPQDKAGIGFPWRNPIASLYIALVPRTLRLMMKSQIIDVKDRLLGQLGRILRPGRAKVA